jgi:nitrogen fixation NifU-like protein
MSDLRELYQEIIVDHSKQPRNKGPLDNSNCSAEGYNPLCGDRVTVFLHVDGDVVTDASFDGLGCAISTASASLMTDAIKGLSRDEVTAIFRSFHNLVTGKALGDDAPDMKKLNVFAGVAEFPMRVKCASLVWHTLQAALNGSAEAVTTE